MRRSTSSTQTTPTLVTRAFLILMSSQNFCRPLIDFSSRSLTFFNAGRATYSDKLFKFRNGRFEDLLSDELNVRRGVANRMAGRSVACVDRKVSKTSVLFSMFTIPSPHTVVALQGTGRYSIYVANYASGNVGPHALLEMDEAASDVNAGIIALSDVAAKAGVNMFTGQESTWRSEVSDVLRCAESAVHLFYRWTRGGDRTNPERVEVGCVL